METEFGNSALNYPNSQQHRGMDKYFLEEVYLELLIAKYSPKHTKLNHMQVQNNFPHCVST